MAANPATDCNHYLPWAVGAYTAIVLLQGAQAHGRQLGLAYWVKANLTAMKVGGRRAGAEVGAEAEIKAKASTRDSNSDGSNSL